MKHWLFRCACWDLPLFKLPLKERFFGEHFFIFTLAASFLTTLTINKTLDFLGIQLRETMKR